MKIARLYIFLLAGILFTLLLSIALTPTPSRVFAQPETVNACANGGDYTTVQAAIDAVAAGGIVTLCAEIFPENLTIDKSLTLRGVGMTRTRIEPFDNTAILISSGHNVTIEELAITTSTTECCGPSGSGIDNSGTLTLNRVDIFDNGRGLLNQGGELTVNNSTVRDNRRSFTRVDGSGIQNLGGTVRVINSIISNNTMSDPDLPDNRGGGIYSDGVALIKGSIVQDNYGVSGGGIYNLGQMIIEDSSLLNNGSLRAGGGIQNNGTLFIRQATIAENRTAGGVFGSACRGHGAGISNTGQLEISESLILSNRTGGADSGDSCYGGGLYNSGSASALVKNTTITQNELACSFNCTGYGGGVANVDNATLTLEFVTLYNNQGGGLANGTGFLADTSSSTTLSHSIIAANTGSPDCQNSDGTITSLGYSIDGDRTCGLNAMGDQPNVDPLVGPLQNNDGAPLTYALLPGSPAIDSGSNSGCPATDQRGVARPQGSACDIGAFEFEEASLPTCGPLQQEAEDGVLYGDFETGFGIRGGQYIHVPEDSAGDEWDGPNPNRRADYCFIVPEAGEYAINGIVYATDGESDSFYVRVNGAPSAGYLWATSPDYLNQYTLDYVNDRDSGADPVIVTLDAGEQIVSIYLREDGTRLDTINLEATTQSATAAACINGNNGADYATVQAAINAVAPGGTVTICAGTYPENLVIAKDVTLIGNDQTNTIIDAQSLATTLIVEPSATVTVENLTLTGGYPDYSGQNEDGGGIFNRGTLTLKRSTITNNQSSDQAGGIYNAGTLTVLDSQITNNQSPDEGGGGIENTSSGQVTIRNSLIRDNVAAIGGAIINAGQVEIINSTIRNNRAGFNSGGIRNGGTLTVESSTVNKNFAGSSGGGFYNTGSLTINNSTITENETRDGDGAGIVNTSGGTTLLTNSTVAFNRGNEISNSRDDHGLSNRPNSTFTVQNSIVAFNYFDSNSPDSDCSGDITSMGHNLSSDNSCAFTQPDDLSNVDPLLGPLADNAGPTQTRALLTSSPAIDAGDNNNCPATDQRGVSRPQGSTCDIGAFEADDNSVQSILGNVDCDNDLDSVDALFTLQYAVDLRSDHGSCPLPDRATQLHAAAGDMNDDGQTNAVDALFMLQCAVGLPNPYCGVTAAGMQVRSTGNTVAASVDLAAHHVGQSITMQVDAQTAAVGAATLELIYDSRRARLTNCVLMGQGACHETAAGTIQIAFVDAAGLSGTQPIAELFFDNADVALTEINATVADSAGQALAVEVTSTDGTPTQLDDPANQLFIPLINR